MTKFNNRHIALSDAIAATIWQYEQGQYRYINEFFKLNKSGADMLLSGIYPNAKEVTESYGAYSAMIHKLKLDPRDHSINVVCVGDGRTPRTATLLAFRTKWNCISVDPNLNASKIPIWENSINRLHCIPARVEDINLLYDHVVIAAVHSHASLPAILDHVRGKVRSLVSIECCVPYNHLVPPTKEYRDSGIWSPKNLVKVWNSI